MLQVDAFGQAIGGDQHTAAGRIGLTHVFDSLTALFRCEFAGDRIDDGAGKVLLEFAGHIVEHPRVQSFAVWLTESLDQMIVSERQRAEAGVALRKHRYGVSKDQP